MSDNYIWGNAWKKRRKKRGRYCADRPTQGTIMTGTEGKNSLKLHQALPYPHLEGHLGQEASQISYSKVTCAILPFPSRFCTFNPSSVYFHYKVSI